MGHSHRGSRLSPEFSLRCVAYDDDDEHKEVTDAGTTVPLSPHLHACRYSDKQYSLYSTKNSDRSPVRLALQSNLTG